MMAPMLACGPRVLHLEHKAKRNFTTRPGREEAIMFNHTSLGEKTSENVLFPIIMEYTLPFKICFSEQQRSFSLREHRMA